MGGHEVKHVVESLIRKIWRAVKGVEVEEFRCMPYQVAMDVVGLLRLSPILVHGAQYGSDKPDTRFDMYVSGNSS